MTAVCGYYESSCITTAEIEIDSSASNFYLHQKSALVEFDLLYLFSGQDWGINVWPQPEVHFGLVDCQVKQAGQGCNSLLCAFAHTLV